MSKSVKIFFVGDKVFPCNIKHTTKPTKSTYV